MTNLYIDGRQAVLPTDTQIKVTTENPLFTDAGTYTLEVALPLEGCADNQRIFGPIHRADVLKAELTAKRWPFVLVAPPLHIEGTARVSSVDNEGVKIQLLAGRSALNDASKNADGEDLYIDELHNIITKDERGFSAIGGLGSVFEKAYREKEPDADFISYYAVRNMWLNGELTHRGRDGDAETVVIPIYSTADKVTANERAVVYWGRRGKYIGVDKGAKVYEMTNDGRRIAPFPAEGSFVDANQQEHLPSDTAFAPQPFLVVVVERLLKALGFNISPEDNAIRGTWQERIIVANCRKTVHIAHMLPHWTVKEFIREVQNFFGVLIITEGRRARIVRKRNSSRSHSTSTRSPSRRTPSTKTPPVPMWRTNLPRSTSECSCPRTWSRRYSAQSSPTCRPSKPETGEMTSAPGATGISSQSNISSPTPRRDFATPIFAFTQPNSGSWR